MQELYDKHDFGEANAALQKLTKDFPDSRGTPKYRLLAELSSVRAAADDAHARDELKSALDRVLQFLSLHQQDPLLKEYHADIWTTLHDLAKKCATEAETHHDADALKLARTPPPRRTNSIHPARSMPSCVSAIWKRASLVLLPRSMRIGNVRPSSTRLSSGSNVPPPPVYVKRGRS